MTETIEKPDGAALDAMNATLRRMHKTPPMPHAPIRAQDEVPNPTNGMSTKRGRRKSHCREDGGISS